MHIGWVRVRGGGANKLAETSGDGGGGSWMEGGKRRKGRKREGEGRIEETSRCSKNWGGKRKYYVLVIS
jgi:hypothetical protein